jgi:VWFA-related protein
MARVLAAIIVAITLASAPQARTQAPPFRGTSDNVPVFVTVTDKNRRLVTHLGRDDFEVRDEGQVRPMTVFDNSPQPVRIIVLLDVSGSMTGNLPLLIDACRQLVAHLSPDDRARVGTFGHDVTISPAFTRDTAALLSALPTMIDPSAPTPLWRAADQAIGDFGEAEGRRVVLLLSDGKDSGPMFGRKYVSELEAVDHAVREDVMIYGIAMHSRPPNSVFAPQAGQNLASLMAADLPDPGLARASEDTGGGYVEIRPRQDLGAAFAEVADELHQQYLLGFTPSRHDGKRHTIEVRLKTKGASARARKAYVAPTAR